MDTLHPLTFRPLLKELVWGGRKLASLLGKPAPADRPIGESWEIVDLPDDQSVVAGGPLAGRTLHDLVERHAGALLGPVPLDGGRFPLLVKYIDAARTLSVQVHPDEAACARVGGRPKNEAWYILDAEPGARLYLGLRPGTTLGQLRDAIAGGGVEALLNEVAVRPGQLVHVRPGTLHAIGAGVLLAEVQQPSDTTFRVYDWGRVGLDGKPRQLHVEEALACTDVDARPAIFDDALDASHFRARVVTVPAGGEEALEGVGPLVVVRLGGAGRLVHGDLAVPLGAGSAALLPHACRPASLRGDAAGDPLRALLVSFPSA